MEGKDRGTEEIPRTLPKQDGGRLFTSIIRLTQRGGGMTPTIGKMNILRRVEFIEAALNPSPSVYQSGLDFCNCGNPKLEESDFCKECI